MNIFKFAQNADTKMSFTKLSIFLYRKENLESFKVGLNSLICKKTFLKYHNLV